MNKTIIGSNYHFPCSLPLVVFKRRSLCQKWMRRQTYRQHGTNMQLNRLQISSSEITPVKAIKVTTSLDADQIDWRMEGLEGRAFRDKVDKHLESQRWLLACDLFHTCLAAVCHHALDRRHTYRPCCGNCRPEHPRPALTATCMYLINDNKFRRPD